MTLEKLLQHLRGPTLAVILDDLRTADLDSASLDWIVENGALADIVATALDDLAALSNA